MYYSRVYSYWEVSCRLPPACWWKWELCSVPSGAYWAGGRKRTGVLRWSRWHMSPWEWKASKQWLKIVTSLASCKKEMVICLFLWVSRYWKLYILHLTYFTKIFALKFSFKIRKNLSTSDLANLSCFYNLF